MVVRCVTDHAGFDNNRRTSVGVGVKELTNRNARLTRFTDERLELQGKELLREPIMADYSQIGSEWTVERDGEERSICDGTQHLRSLR